MNFKFCLIAVALCAIAFTGSPLAEAASRGVECDNPTRAGEDRVNITPPGGSSIVIKLPITQAQADDPEFDGVDKAALLAAAIDAHADLQAVVQPAGSANVIVTDNAGQMCSIGFTTRTGERWDKIPARERNSLDTTDLARLSIDGVITGVTPNSQLAHVDAGLISNRVSLATAGYATLPALRFALRAELVAAGIPAVLEPDGTITYLVQTTPMGTDGPGCGTDDQGLETTVELED